MELWRVCYCLLPWTTVGWEGYDEPMITRKPSPSTLHNTIVLQDVHNKATTSFAPHTTSYVFTCLVLADIELNHTMDNCTCLRDQLTRYNPSHIPKTIDYVIDRNNTTTSNNITTPTTTTTTTTPTTTTHSNSKSTRSLIANL